MRSCKSDIFDGGKYDFLLPRRTRKAIALGLIVGVAFVPPVKRWYLDQIEHHAQHTTREFMSQLTSDTSELPPREASRDQTRRR